MKKKPEPQHPPAPQDQDNRSRRPWSRPTIKDLPPLKDLTLQTGGAIGGGESVFP